MLRLPLRIVVPLALSLAATASLAQSAPPSAPPRAAPTAPASQPMAPDPTMLLSKMHQVNQMEMNLGRMAEKKGNIVEVRRYGRVLYRDHRHADGMVRDYARRHGYQLVTPQPMTPMEQAQAQQQMKTMQMLETAHGPAFDRAFSDAMAMGHAQVVGMLSHAEPMIQQRGLRDMVSKFLPILRQHLALARYLQKRTRAEKE